VGGAGVGAATGAVVFGVAVGPVGATVITVFPLLKLPVIEGLAEKAVIVYDPGVEGAVQSTVVLDPSVLNVIVPVQTALPANGISAPLAKVPSVACIILVVSTLVNVKVTVPPAATEVADGPKSKSLRAGKVVVPALPTSVFV